MEKVRLEIARITPGMKLAEPITNAAGITLMPAGIRLTPMFIARIRKWNIESLEVMVEKKAPVAPDAARSQPRHKTSVEVKTSTAGQPPPRERALTPEEEDFARSIAAEVSKTFINPRKNPLMMLLRAIAVKRLALEGIDAPINFLRRGPQDKIPLPEENA